MTNLDGAGFSGGDGYGCGESSGSQIATYGFGQTGGSGGYSNSPHGFGVGSISGSGTLDQNGRCSGEGLGASYLDGKTGRGLTDGG